MIVTGSVCNNCCLRKFVWRRRFRSLDDDECHFFWRRKQHVTPRSVVLFFTNEKIGRERRIPRLKDMVNGFRYSVTLIRGRGKQLTSRRRRHTTKGRIDWITKATPSIRKPKHCQASATDLSFFQWKSNLFLTVNQVKIQVGTTSSSKAAFTQSCKNGQLDGSRETFDLAKV